MSAILIDGKKKAQIVKDRLAVQVAAVKENGVVPCLKVFLVGDDPASAIYVRNKKRAAEKIGMASETVILPGETTEIELLNLIDEANNDDSVHGILVQLPLPKQIASSKVIEAISPDKDVDGFHPVSRGKLVAGEDTFLPCTPAGMQVMLREYDIDPKGKHVVVVGRSGIVGMPFTIMMLQKKAWANATVTCCHTGTGDLKPYTLQADILVAAAGRPNTITADMVKKGVVVIDVGMNRVDDPTTEKGYRLCGDVDFEPIKDIASAITPVPGGVGPMTIAMLLQNTVKAAKQLNSL